MGERGGGELGERGGGGIGRERGGGGIGRERGGGFGKLERSNSKILKLNLFNLCFFTIQKYTMPLLGILIERDIEMKV